MAINPFSQDQLDKLVAETLPAVPTGHDNALVGTLDQNGVQLVATFKLGIDDRWEITGAARHDWSGDNEVGASVIYSWKS